MSDQEAVAKLDDMQQSKYVKLAGNIGKLTMGIQLSTPGCPEKINVAALLDSRCDGSSIDHCFVLRNKIPTRKGQNPMKVTNADGMENKHGMIKEYVILRVQIDEHVEELDFAVMQLNSANVFLGLDWLRHHNPLVNWNMGQLQFENCPKECQQNSVRSAGVDEVQIETQAQEQWEVLEVLREQVEGRKYSYEPIKTVTFEEVVPKHYHEYKDVFDEKEFDELPQRRTWDHAIELEEGFTPARGHIFPLNPGQEKEMNEFIDKNLRTGRIRPSKSPNAASFFFVEKKGDTKRRPVQDYRRLNGFTRKNRYPLPLIGEMISGLKHSKVLSKMDVRWGYNNIRIREGDEWKAAFHTKRGLFEPTVMFFRLTNSPATFQAFMNEIFKDLIREEVVKVYMDDILVFTDTIEEHQEVNRRVFQILRENKLYLKAAKCEFEKDKVEFLGVIIGNGQVRMDPKKVAVIRDWPVPKKKKDVQAFLGFCNFYRRFIKDFGKITKPLTSLTGNEEFQWGIPQQLAYEGLKEAVVEETVLFIPQDGGKYKLEADASNYAMGAVLSQFVNE